VPHFQGLREASQPRKDLHPGALRGDGQQKKAPPVEYQLFSKGIFKVTAKGPPIGGHLAKEIREAPIKWVHWGGGDKGSWNGRDESKQVTGGEGKKRRVKGQDKTGDRRMGGKAHLRHDCQTRYQDVSTQ